MYQACLCSLAGPSIQMFTFEWFYGVQIYFCIPFFILEIECVDLEYCRFICFSYLYIIKTDETKGENMANLQVEYKQSTEYVNELPGKFFKIHSVTSLIETRYNNALPKTSDPNEFLKRPIRYTFSVFARNKKEERLPFQNLYIFDDKTTAKIAYKQVMGIWIDEQLEPYRKLVNKGKTLTPFQIEKCQAIQDLLPED